MTRLIQGTSLLLFAAAGAFALPAHTMENRPGERIAETGLISRAEPENAKYFYNRGTGFYGREEYGAAIKDFSTAIVLEPGSSDAYFNRGLSFRRQHKIDEAIADFTKAIALYPDQPGYYFERCNARIVKNDFSGAVADGSEAIRLSPEEPGPYFLRGLASMLSGDLDGAFADSSKALELNSEYRDAKRLLMETLLRMETASSKIGRSSWSGSRRITWL